MATNKGGDENSTIQDKSAHFLRRISNFFLKSNEKGNVVGVSDQNSTFLNNKFHRDKSDLKEQPVTNKNEEPVVKPIYAYCVVPSNVDTKSRFSEKFPNIFTTLKNKRRSERDVGDKHAVKRYIPMDSDSSDLEHSFAEEESTVNWKESKCFMHDDTPEFDVNTCNLEI